MILSTNLMAKSKTTQEEVMASYQRKQSILQQKYMF